MEGTKKNRIIYWIFTIWMALGMVSTGLGQLFKQKTGAAGADSIAHLGYPVYFLTIIGLWKILGSIVALAPKLPVLKEWAYAGFFFTMTGAVISHIIMRDTITDILPALLLLTLTLISWYSRPADRKVTELNR